MRLLNLPRGFLLVAFLAMAAVSQNSRGEEPDFQTLLARAQTGDVAAQEMVGLMYCNGVGTTQDFHEGRNWLQKAANNGRPSAKTAIGLFYDKGLGVPQDSSMAFEWYAAGANAGDPAGEELVADCYAMGKGTPKDQAQAIEWYTRSAAQGNVQAQTNLGLIYQNGIGVSKNSKVAFTYFLQAASHNFGPAQYHVALCYWNGVFVPRDPVKAYVWCTLAVHMYNGKEAADLLDTITAKLSFDEQKQGDDMVAQMTADHEGNFPTSTAVGTFVSGQSAKMPFRYVAGHIVVTANVMGRGHLQFLIDTGASASFLDEQTAKALDIHPGDSYMTGSGIGKNLLLSAVADSIHFALAGLAFENVSFRLFSTSTWDKGMGMHTDGIIGCDILQKYALHIDYVHRTIEFLNSPAVDGVHAGDPVPLTIEHGLALVDAKISKFNVESNPAKFILDTGSNESIALTRNFLAANPHLKFSKGVYSYSLGGGGSVDEVITRASQVSFGDVVIRNPNVHLIAQNQGLWAGGFGGNIGNDLLQHFDVTIDFPGKMLYLKPMARFRDTSEYDAGLALKTGGWFQKNVVATAVTPGSPAASAGLKAGDVLLQIDGKPLKGVSLNDTRALIRQPGNHRVIVKRSGKTIFLQLQNE